MARFRGTMQGRRGETSRLGDAKSGLWMKANTWSGNIQVQLFARDDVDWVTVTHVDKHNDCRELYHGPIEKYHDPRGKVIALFKEGEHPNDE